MEAFMEVFAIIGIVFCVASLEFLVFGISYLFNDETEGAVPLMFFNTAVITLLLADRWMR